MKAQTCLLLLLGGLATCDATARLGETEEQSRRRYGEPLQPGDDHFRAQPVLKSAVTRTYSYRGWWIRPAFVDGRTVRLTYTKIEGGVSIPPFRRKSSTPCSRMKPARERGASKQLQLRTQGKGRWGTACKA